MSGEIRIGNKIFMKAAQSSAHAIETGIFKPDLSPVPELKSGLIGYVATGLKDVSLCRVGDTITLDPATSSLEGYQEIRPMVYAAFYPVETEDYELLKDGLSKLKLNDSSLVYEPESSSALGNGFRCGFLGLLHLEVVQERLERNYNLSLIATSPTVKYKVILTNGQTLEVDSPSKFPLVNNLRAVEEPFVLATISAPAEHLGAILELLNSKRGKLNDMSYLGRQVLLKVDMPLSEIIVDFFQHHSKHFEFFTS